MSELNLDEEEVGGTVTLTSKEGTSIQVDKKNALISNLVKHAFDCDANASTITVQTSAAILAKIVEYMNEHKGTEATIIEKPLRSKVMKDVVNYEFDATFIDSVDEHARQDLYDLILAANYMDIKGLLHLGCAKVASLIKGQPLEKIKDILAKGTTTSGKKTE